MTHFQKFLVALITMVVTLFTGVLTWTLAYYYHPHHEIQREVIHSSLVVATILLMGTALISAIASLINAADTWNW